MRCVLVSLSEPGRLLAQVGVLAAAGLVSLQKILPHVLSGSDHRTAKKLAEGLRDIVLKDGEFRGEHPFVVDVNAVQTNMVFFHVLEKLCPYFRSEVFHSSLKVPPSSILGVAVMMLCFADGQGCRHPTQVRAVSLGHSPSNP